MTTNLRGALIEVANSVGVRGTHGGRDSKRARSGSGLDVESEIDNITKSHLHDGVGDFVAEGEVSASEKEGSDKEILDTGDGAAAFAEDGSVEEGIKEWSTVEASSLGRDGITASCAAIGSVESGLGGQCDLDRLIDGVLHQGHRVLGNHVSIAHVTVGNLEQGVSESGIGGNKGLAKTGSGCGKCGTGTFTGGIRVNTAGAQVVLEQTDACSGAIGEADWVSAIDLNTCLTEKRGNVHQAWDLKGADKAKVGNTSSLQEQGGDLRAISVSGLVDNVDEVDRDVEGVGQILGAGTAGSGLAGIAKDQGKVD